MEERWLVYRALKMGRVRREITDDEGGRRVSSRQTKMLSLKALLMKAYVLQVT